MNFKCEGVNDIYIEMEARTKSAHKLINLCVDDRDTGHSGSR